MLRALFEISIIDFFLKFYFRNTVFDAHDDKFDNTFFKYPIIISLHIFQIWVT